MFFTHFSATQNDDHIVSVADVKRIAQREVPGVTAHRYNRWLKAEGCDIKATHWNRETGKSHRVVRRLVINDMEAQMSSKRHAGEASSEPAPKHQKSTSGSIGDVLAGGMPA